MIEIDGKIFKEMLAGGAKALDINRSTIDELNVFPVPDGDTGTNMSLTTSSAIREVNTSDKENLDEVALFFSKGALKGARGNSGVILSQIFKGFAVMLDTKATMNAKDFASCLKKGTEIAYGAVTKPKEGTILTVVRVMAETAITITKGKNMELEDFLKAVLQAGEEILAKTPEMLPVLAKAGVVDAGGRGFLTIMDGMYRTFVGDELILLNGDSVKVSVNEPKTASKIENTTLDNDYEHITFQYCTEFFITHLKRETTESDVDKFRDYLMTIGDCVLVIGDLDLVKTHVHTNNPDLALKAALKYGELDGVKIENMAEQNRKIRGVAEDSKKEELKDFAMVSICSGEGMTNIFRDLLVDQTIEGGQTMNPSVYDILGAINNAKAKNVFVLPNNSNIILAANQAKELADTNVYVLPTTCMPEGIAAALVFSENVSADENFENMKNAANGVMSAEVTHAVRSTRMNGFTVKDGDIIGIYNKKIVAKSQSIAEATMMTVSKIVAKAEMLTLYYGENVTAEDANLMVERLTTEYPDLEIATYYGGQPHYFYIISAE
ncbi:MAG: DAK2 domain-containing protein [Clostridia bacterium]